MRYFKLKTLYIDCLIPVALLISYFLGFLGQLLMAYFAVLIHEAAHAFVALTFGCKIRKAYLLYLGTRIELDITTESSIKKCIIYACGPLINFLMAFISYLISLKYDYDLINIFIISNLCLGAFNLLPLSPLDGGEILSVFTSSKYGLFYSQKISRITFLILIVLLLTISLPVALFTGNYSILLIVTFLLFRDQKYGEAAFMNAKSLYYRRARLIKKGYYGVREIVVLDRLTLGDAFKLMDFDQYHLLIILDENMKIIHRFTESELLAALNDYGYSCTFKELINVTDSSKN